MNETYDKFKKEILEMLDGKIEPTLGDFGSVLDKDTVIDPLIGDLDVCVCVDDDGNALNQCNECPR